MIDPARSARSAGVIALVSAIDLLGVKAVNFPALRLELRGQQLVLDREWFGRDDEAPDLLFRQRRAVHLVEMAFQSGLVHGRRRRRHDRREEGPAGPVQNAFVHVRMFPQPFLERSHQHVAAAAQRDDVVRPPENVEISVVVEVTDIMGPDPAIGQEHLSLSPGAHHE